MASVIIGVLGLISVFVLNYFDGRRRFPSSGSYGLGSSDCFTPPRSYACGWCCVGSYEYVAWYPDCAFRDAAIDSGHDACLDNIVHSYWSEKVRERPVCPRAFACPPA